ncbi:uncharacterized protein LOC103697568 isoform X1 [Phoenix dactylifera]|uniref:Uncharacterized protein LOC103697568 isoform X1 n=1 Tax=Phoenix dactylifera TaxID=42345 RepID=A0A8B7BIJ0_PHODC|nr:uncharacterized protein LOC103697568 isoform X1 [Phoenix dactylifera]
MDSSGTPDTASVGEDTLGEKETAENKAPSDGREEPVVDVSGQTWEVSLFERPPSDGAPEGLYVYRNTFHLVPRAIGQLGRLKTLKFFANDIEVLPPEAGDLVELERLQVKVTLPGISGIPFGKLRSLKELELCKAPPRSSAFSILSEVSALQCLTKLSICHFSIRYLPPEIGCLKKLEELDLSFNKLKNLPNDIAELSALRSLKVANNKLVDLPLGISSLRSLENLDLSNNRLTSLTSLKLASMLTLQYLNLQYNKLPSDCQIPSWICYNFKGNGEGIAKDEMTKSLAEVDVQDVAVHRSHCKRSCNGCSTSSCLHPEASSGYKCHATQRMKKGWKRRDYLQQRARQERLNYSRKWKSEDQNDNMTEKMAEENDSCMENRHSELHIAVDEEKLLDGSAKSGAITEDISSTADGDGCGLAKDGAFLILHDCADNEKVGLHKRDNRDNNSCITSESSGLNKDCDLENEREDNVSPVYPLTDLNVPDEYSSSEASKFILKSKRHSDKDLDNPKPSKFRRPVDECSNLSCKYSTESFCSIDDHLPDGFYDAGRDRPFMSLQDYEQSLCLDSREVILLDREKDEELDAIAFSAQVLMSSLKWSSLTAVSEEDGVDNLQRASVLALFVSDCFGGSDRSASVMRTRRAIAGLNKQQPFVCTCSAANTYDNSGDTLKQMHGILGSLNFNDLCEKSLRFIKETRNSNVVPIGILRFGVCRHRAVLMKYLCDRADPPIPCELVRGYLDFMAHAWNTILVRRGNSWVRMIVDVCYPTDIREETDPEYFCRYIPLSRLNVPLETLSSPIFRCSFPSFSLYSGNENASRSVFHCKFGTVDAAVKVRKLEACVALDEKIRDFEYTFLGEVRMLGALKKHRCIVDIYGHQLASKWVSTADGNKEYRLLQSIIVMEYVKGGSLKSYLGKLAKKGEKHVPVDVALSIARDVAWALVEVHSKHIIHRDIKSENILIDLDSGRSDGTPIVKLSDFDRSVPLQSFAHTCCIAHLGIHPPDVCVGTPRWMAPEVVQAMHKRNPYGLEVDIWSYGCLLLELLTLQIPYIGQSESEIYDLLQMKQRPRLTPELEALASPDEPKSRSKSEIFCDSDAKILKLLVDLFYQCTSGNPADRPTAQDIYDSLFAVSSQSLET